MIGRQFASRLSRANLSRLFVAGVEPQDSRPMVADNGVIGATWALRIAPRKISEIFGESLFSSNNHRPIIEWMGGVLSRFFAEQTNPAPLAKYQRSWNTRISPHPLHTKCAHRRLLRLLHFCNTDRRYALHSCVTVRAKCAVDLELFLCKNDGESWSCFCALCRVRCGRLVHW